MRAILVDWLVEVAEEYRLCADTLYLTVNYIDRFLSVYPVQRSQLQLVGVACMWVAAKYEEIYPPNVSDFCFITDNTYTKEQMVAMEELVLKRLGYELTVPTAKTFLRRMLQVGWHRSLALCWAAVLLILYQQTQLQRGEISLHGGPLNSDMAGRLRTLCGFMPATQSASAHTADPAPDTFCLLNTCRCATPTSTFTSCPTT
jgi:hypothetical protein